MGDILEQKDREISSLKIQVERQKALIEKLECIAYEAEGYVNAQVLLRLIEKYP